MTDRGEPSLVDFLRARISESISLAEDVERRREGLGSETDEPTRALADLMRAQAQARLEVVREEESRLDDSGGTSVLRWLASPYTAHADYRPEWRPAGPGLSG